MIDMYGIYYSLYSIMFNSVLPVIYRIKCRL